MAESDKPVSRLGVAAIAIFITSVLAAYLSAEYFEMNGPYQLGKYLGGLLIVGLLVKLGSKASRAPSKPAALALASILITGLVYSQGFYREVQQARLAYQTIMQGGSLDPSSIGPATHGRYAPVLKWRAEREVRFAELVSRITNESAGMHIPAVFDPMAMGDPTGIPSHREAFITFRKFATEARGAIQAELDAMEQDGKQRFPELDWESEDGESPLVAKRYWDAFWGTELEMVDAALEALALMEANGYEVDSSRGVFLFPDDQATAQFNALLVRMQLAAKKQADAENMVQGLIRELEESQPEWAR